MKALPINTAIRGHALDLLRTFPDESVHCCVTSPPYWGLRDYGLPGQIWDGGNGCKHRWGQAIERDVGNDPSDKTTLTGGMGIRASKNRAVFGQECVQCDAWRGSLGLEPTPELYVRHLVEIFREVRRVLRKDGTCWINIGDTRTKDRQWIGIPHKLVFALQKDNWRWEDEIIWAKKNCMPESATNRTTRSHELVMVMNKSKSCFYDADAVREPQTGNAHSRGNENGNEAYQEARGSYLGWKSPSVIVPGGRNLRSVWEIAIEPSSEAHFSTYPTKLAAKCIKAGTSEYGSCAECGAPWERITDPVEGNTSPSGWKTGPGSHQDLTGRFDSREYDGKRKQEAKNAAGRRLLLNMKKRRDSGEEHDNPFPPKRILGWRPTCKCNGDPQHWLKDAPESFPLPVPCTVLDPFIGTGRTAMAAKRLGRRWIGIDLSEKYIEMTRKNTAQQEIFA